jgi:hypothetical protein
LTHAASRGSKRRQPWRANASWACNSTWTVRRDPRRVRRVPSATCAAGTLRPALVDHGAAGLVREGNGCARLVASVDEYVPQFYDARFGGPGQEIAEPVDARRWAPVFERSWARPYRIGLSAFGRIQRVRCERMDPVARGVLPDVKLLDLWSRGLRVVHAERTGRRSRWSAGTLPVRTAALAAGDAWRRAAHAQSVRSGNEAARMFGGLCAGRRNLPLAGADRDPRHEPRRVAESLTGAARWAAPPRLQVSDGEVAPDGTCVDLNARLDDRFPFATAGAAARGVE